MKTIRTQHGIAADYCYPHSEKLSLICPECGINSVHISPPEITYGEGGFRGLVVTIRCECKNLHIFSVVFGQHKGMTFLRTDVEARAGLRIGPEGAYRSEPMKRQRHTEEQIIAVLQEAQAGATIEELCRRHGISQSTYYKWKQKFSGMEVNDRRRFRQGLTSASYCWRASATMNSSVAA